MSTKINSVITELIKLEKNFVDLQTKKQKKLLTRYNKKISLLQTAIQRYTHKISSIESKLQEKYKEKEDLLIAELDVEIKAKQQNISNELNKFNIYQLVSENI